MPRGLWAFASPSGSWPLPAVTLPCQVVSTSCPCHWPPPTRTFKCRRFGCYRCECPEGCLLEGLLTVVCAVFWASVHRQPSSSNSVYLKLSLMGPMHGPGCATKIAHHAPQHECLRAGVVQMQRMPLHVLSDMFSRVVKTEIFGEFCTILQTPR